ncbi:MAG: formyltetrahydrofolate deformylase [Myxococcota bacterium]|jgi:formyltetrahydrofolate deformylase|nr:formyltetrahydrofolate deformylase [Myxococcota bacterium]
MQTYRLWISTPDQPGLIYKISKSLLDEGFNIEENHEFVDKEGNLFLMRTEIVGEGAADILEQKLTTVLPEDSTIEVIPARKKNIVVLGTKEAHCLGDILIQHDSGELTADIQAVISNHQVLGELVQRFELPFHHVTHEGCTRQEHEAQVMDIIDSFSPDLIVLAKYMRVLTPAFVERYAGKILNIHHSFLPAFVGANPYKQAHQRGVKIIGATAHVVSDDLDEGPIIAQNVVHVDHSYTWQAMRQAGRHVEKVVLTKALELLLEDRVFVFGNKTVVF